ncbi:MAG TPA: twin-arginine translocation signal domain-containing protein [Chitinophagaceae bacterium]|nr:twin-arginine translocation signal domain-containing protein [Chitinophagaceae bacterium]
MEDQNLQSKSPRRQFISNVAAGAAALGLGSLVSLDAMAGIKDNPQIYADADEWFSKLKGKHRMVFDVPEPNGLMPFAWPLVYLMTNEKTGTPMKDSNAVVILRHSGIPYAFNNSVWEKYKFGEIFHLNDPKTKAASIRNFMYQAKPEDFNIPGIGPAPLAINDLQGMGVMFGVCDMAMQVNSAAIAQMTKGDAAAIKKDWEANLLPGVQVLPSGVWAIGRAQEHGCGYCFAGGAPHE